MSLRSLRPFFAAALLAAGLSSAAPAQQRENLIGGGRAWMGLFTQTEQAVYPWTGVDEAGWLRKAVAMPSCHPFITKSNQFSYAWLGYSASMVDLDGDGLPDIVSPDGNGMVWFWKNTGQPGKPVFGYGEVMPLLIDDLRSAFAPVFRMDAPKEKAGSKRDSRLTPAQEAEKRRVDERREREFQRLKRRNDRLPKDKKRDEKELRREAEEMHPYEWEKSTDGKPEESDPTPAGRFVPGAQIPPGGLVCTLNTFRRLRLILAPADWNGDGAVDFLAGDSGGTVYFAPNNGGPGRPDFGYVTRLTSALPLKVARVAAEPGRPPRLENVSFMNYAMPFPCDWDGNGIPDLLVGEGTYSVNTIRLFTDAARATIQNPPPETALYAGEDRTFLAPFAHDWDGDGDLDLFVCDAAGRLTVHPRDGAAIGAPLDCLLDGGNAPLAYCAPQPCDWNDDGVMDLIWGEPFGRIMVALGKEKGGRSFYPPEAVRSVRPAEMVAVPAAAGFGRTISLAAVPARLKDGHGGVRNGGTADARRFYRADGTRQENIGGWPNADNTALYGQMPSWLPVPPPALEDQLEGDGAGRATGRQVSWGVAPFPGDVWEVVEEPGAPGGGNTLRLRWHDARQNAVFKTLTAAPPHWTPGAAVFFHSGSPKPFSDKFTSKPVTIKFYYKLDGAFSRMDVIWHTSWGPLVNGKPPAEGGSVTAAVAPPPAGGWAEFSHTEEPHEEYQRGLQGSLAIQFLGRGEIRIRDVRVFEGE